MTARRSGPETVGGVEWPTVGLAAVIYGLWAAATYFHDRLPWPVLVVVGGWAIAWHGSLQHEIIHGHPTRSRRLNTALGFAPLSLWLPFEIYRQTHQAHHATEQLTDPAHDPETRYLPASASRLRRAAAALQATLLGRLVLGPAIEIGGFWLDEIGRVGRCEPGRLALWLGHGLAVGLIVAWLWRVCHMPLWLYGLCFIYPGAALSLLRSFAEHRADPTPRRRVAVVERAPILGLLFLNNNLHAAHHDRPGAPWHSLPAFYAKDRERLLRANGGLVYDGYGEIVRRFLFRRHDRAVYPASDGASA
ncbi:fatty acid desaturase [Caulobacter soli]|uniref:fatty acid desaturase n=1 Tax=Caulobacter soli TaxID=2708539 RepID=UPI00196B29A4|nr:fatty acid desaturase [Caulobacter soli]